MAGSQARPTNTCIPNYPGSAQLAYASIVKVWQRRELNGSLIHLLNYFEYMSAYYLSGVTNKKTTIASFQPRMKRWFIALRDYIEYVDSTRHNQKTWPPFLELMKEWGMESMRGREFDDPAH